MTAASILPEGLVAPNLTPFNHNLSIATDLYIEHALRLLEEGCGGLAPFGTTGEALSLGINERISTLDSLVAAGVAPESMIVGTGLTSLADTLRLTRHATDLGVAATMILPPFYFKDPPDDGLHRYFESLIEAMAGAVRIVLYHIPQMAGVGFSVELVARLRRDFPDQVVAIKDSSGDWDNTAQLFDIDGLVVYPGSELPLLDALALGGRELISATANLNASAIVDVLQLWQSGDRNEARDRHGAVAATRRVFAGYGPIPAQKRLLAMRTGDERWANVRPPLLSMDGARGRSLADELAAIPVI